MPKKSTSRRTSRTRRDGPNLKIRDRLPAAIHRQLNAPILESVAAFKSGRASITDQANLAAAFSVAYRLSEKIPRHRHLLPEIQPALDALTALYERFAGEPEDTPWVCDACVVEHFEIAARIYAAAILATSGVHVRRAIGRVLRDA